MTIVTPPPAIDRDRFGRPLVVPPAGGKPIPYTRCTTYIDVLEDKFNLQQWEKRMVALGLADRPDLMLSIAAHRDDKKQLNQICNDAKEAAAASAAATTGTALHALTELVDRDQPLPVLPDTARADLEAYKDATADLRTVHIEQFCVLDQLKIGGTPDRIVAYKGQRYIADIKTGSIEYGALKIAMQLAVYARSHTYDIATSERGRHDADLTRGLIIHLPAGEATCRLYWVDLVEGWDAVTVARKVREKRALKFASLTQPFEGSLEKATPEQPAPVTGASPEPSLADQIRTCPTPDAVRELWAAHASEWSDDLSEVAKAHIASIQKAS